jgi:hypothetical protein
LISLGIRCIPSRPAACRRRTTSSTSHGYPATRRLRAAHPVGARTHDATIRSEADAEAVAVAKAEIDSATARLRARQLDGPYGIRFVRDGDSMPWGNVVIGLRNPVAPPLVIERRPDG